MKQVQHIRVFFVLAGLGKPKTPDKELVKDRRLKSKTEQNLSHHGDLADYLKAPL